MSLVHNLPQLIQAISKDSLAPFVVIGINTFRVAKLQKSTPRLLAAIDSCFAEIDGEISYNLQTTMTSVCEFSSMGEASRFLDEVADAFQEHEPVGLTATLYHHGQVVERVEQTDHKHVTRTVQ